MKKLIGAALVSALLFSCSVNSFEADVREEINNGSEDPEFNRRRKETFAQYVGWDVARETAKEFCQWSEQGLTAQELNKKLEQKVANMGVPQEDQFDVLITLVSFKSISIEHFCPGRDI